MSGITIKKHTLLDVIYYSLPLMVYLFLTYNGVIEFKLWPQVLSIWNSQFELSQLLLHPHGIRFFLVLPIFTISEIIEVSSDWLYSNLVPVLIFIATIFIVGSLKNSIWQNKYKREVFLFVFIMLTLISFFMNGRLIFAITGAAILLNIMVNWEDKHLIIVFLLILCSFILVSVSSGTLFVAVLSCSLFVLIKGFFLNRCLVRKLFFLILFSSLFVFIYPLLSVLVMKNINYFGGGFGAIVNMLNHGFGVFFHDIDFVVLILISLCLVISLILMLALVVKYKKIRIPLFFSCVSLGGGLFGFSTMMMVIPSLLLLSLIIIQPKI